MTASVFDCRISTLGEGGLWHPLRQQFFWFDILGGKLHTVSAESEQFWALGELASAAGWVDQDRLIVGSETGLWLFDIRTGLRDKLADIEAEDPTTRSNDGRADPWGGFWISTIGKTQAKGAGSIYRYYKGEVRKLFGDITIPNSICFSREQSRAYFSDTPTHQVMQVSLDAETGWPSGIPEVFLNFADEDRFPDGAVIDADGNIWIAQWGSSRVAAYDAEGKLLKVVSLSVPQVTCPAFGGADMATLYVTTARENMEAEEIAKFPQSGMVFYAQGVGRGREEPPVIIL